MHVDDATGDDKAKWIKAYSLDRDLRDEADWRFRNANMSLEELDIAGTALLGRDYIEEYRLAVVKAGACDPNMLGIIIDFVLEVDAIDTAVSVHRLRRRTL